MTISSIGYDGSIDEVQWASIVQFLGQRYAVNGLDLTIAGAGDRAVTLAAGSAYGYGVLDTSSAPTVLNAASVSSGSRWDTVVMRRDWSGAGGTSHLVIVQGTAAKAVSAALNATPGTLDDQELFLIRVQAGQTAVQEVADLRTVPSRLSFMPGAIQPDPNRFRFGEQIVLDNPKAGGLLDLLVRRGAAPNAAWDPLLAPKGAGTDAFTTITLAPGMTAYDNTPYWTRSAGKQLVGGTVQRSSGADFVANTVYTICTFAGINAPRKEVVVPTACSFTGAAGSGRARIGTDGVVEFRPAANTAWFSLDGLSWFPKGS